MLARAGTVRLVPLPAVDDANTGRREAARAAGHRRGIIFPNWTHRIPFIRCGAAEWPLIASLIWKLYLAELRELATCHGVDPDDSSELVPAGATPGMVGGHVAGPKTHLPKMEGDAGRSHPRELV